MNGCPLGSELSSEQFYTLLGGGYCQNPHVVLAGKTIYEGGQGTFTSQKRWNTRVIRRNVIIGQLSVPCEERNGVGIGLKCRLNFICLEVND